jgi:LysM repeat protein
VTIPNDPLEAAPHDPSDPRHPAPGADAVPAAAEASEYPQGATPAPSADAAGPEERQPADGQGADTCTYLAAPDGWRSTGPSRDHRCTALDPAAAIALDKQRRLCLVAAHRGCPTYMAARSAREQALVGVPDGWVPDRRFVRTGPVVIEAAPRRRSVPFSLGSHRLAEAAVAVMALVVVVLVGSRIVGGAVPEPTSKPTPAVTPIPSGTQAAGGGSMSPTPTGSTPASPVASAVATTSAEPSPEASPSASVAERTYTVKSGDTLTAIGARFGVAWQAIAKANKLKSPYRIVRGQVLVIP